jgi:hypothetical protein
MLTRRMFASFSTVITLLSLEANHSGILLTLERDLLYLFAAFGLAYLLSERLNIGRLFLLLIV